MLSRTTLLFAIVLLASTAFAQKNELAVSVGGYFPLSISSEASAGLALQGTFGHRIASIPFLSAYLELPVIGTRAGISLPSFSQGFSARNYSALFITPGLKVKFAPSFPVSPYLVAGGGYARFNTKFTDSSTSSHSAGAVDIGGGLDFRFAPFVGARIEVRDIYSGSPQILQLITGSQQQVVTTVGLVLHF